jgi:hypothetical protein
MTVRGVLPRRLPLPRRRGSGSVRSRASQRRQYAAAVSARRYRVGMSADRIWTAAELEAMTPNERDATVRAGFVTDPSAVPPELLERARRKSDARIVATEDSQTNR